MSIYGDGFAVDTTFKLDANLRTTTSQYKIVSMVPGTSTADYTVQEAGASSTVADATTASYYPIGILQSYQSSGSLIGTVRMFGRAKVACADSITAGEWVKCYEGAQTTTANSRISAVGNGSSMTVATDSVTAQNVILGRALEDGSTGTVISIFLNPQLYDTGLI